MNTVERVARAMFEAGWPHEKEREEYQKRNPGAMDGYRRLALAALKALMEPSEDHLMRALHEIDDLRAPMRESRQVFREFWRAAISAAIQEAETEG